MNIRTPALLTLAATGLLTLSPFAARRVFAHGDKHPASAPASAPMSAPASTPAAKNMMTLKGEVIDMGCYLGHNSKGASHIKCAQMCAKMGMPIGLLTDSGTLYLLTMAHDDPAPFNAAKAKVGTTITITGDVHENSGIKALEVKKIAA